MAEGQPFLMQSRKMPCFRTIFTIHMKAEAPRIDSLKTILVLVNPWEPSLKTPEIGIYSMK